MKSQYIINIDDIGEREIKEAKTDDDGCLKKILAFIVAVLLTATLLWLTSCKSYKQPKHSYEKIQTTIPNRG
jgi:hypothetical protein